MSSNTLTSNEFDLFYDSFPSNVKRRVRALKKLLYEKLEIEGNFQREVFDLQIKYDAKYAANLDKRCDIISGKHEPNDKECDFALDEDELLCDNMKQKMNLQEKEEEEVKDIKGIPGFWLMSMKMDEEISTWIETHDEPVLYHLVDIKVIRSVNPSKLTLKFFFDPNDYFTNRELTKEYEIRFGPDPKNPWELEDCLCVDRKGCSIDWKNGKNVTQMTRKIKTARKRNKASSTRIEILNSFFDFFSPEKGDQNIDNIKEHLANDWELGKQFCNSFVTNAVLYLTGDMFDDNYSNDSSDTSDSESVCSSGSSCGRNEKPRAKIGQKRKN